MFKRFDSSIWSRYSAPSLFAMMFAMTSTFAHSASQIVDSTGVKKSLVPTLVMPPAGLTESNVKTIIQNDRGGSNTIPPGYTEVSVPMGKFDIGDGQGAYGLPYYTGIGYTVQQYLGPAGFDPCGGNVTSPPRIVQVPEGYCDTGDGGGCFPGKPHYFVCEPLGTRTSLVKVVGNQTVNITPAMFNATAAQYPPSIGMSVVTATPYCQALGYVNYVPGSIYSNPPGSCSQQITRWNGTAFYNDNACYNNILYSMQCYK